MLVSEAVLYLLNLQNSSKQSWCYDMCLIGICHYWYVSETHASSHLFGYCSTIIFKALDGKVFDSGIGLFSLQNLWFEF